MAKIYRVYVIELDIEVREHAKFRRANPTTNPFFPSFYVGQTAHDPKHRFKQHQQGGLLANRFVYKYGICLRPDIYENFGPVPTRKAALALEKAVAAELRQKGHGVWSN